MVTDQSKWQVFLETVREWTATLPQASVTIEERQPRYEYEREIVIKPVGIDSFTLTIGIRCDDTYDVLIQNSLGYIEATEIPVSDDVGLDLLKAVTRGQIRQLVWECKGKIVRTETELMASSSVWKTWKTHFGWIWCRFFGLAKPRLIEYQPWNI